uniref:Uncharacterized protein n=1 Tax=Sipha flava TaxID=143950 RepID=A0A2S2QCJ3_9HEMI
MDVIPQTFTADEDVSSEVSLSMATDVTDAHRPMCYNGFEYVKPTWRRCSKPDMMVDEKPATKCMPPLAENIPVAGSTWAVGEGDESASAQDPQHSYEAVRAAIERKAAKPPLDAHERTAALPRAANELTVAKPPRATRKRTATKPPRDAHERTAAGPRSTDGWMGARSRATVGRTAAKPPRATRERTVAKPPRAMRERTVAKQPRATKERTAPKPPRATNERTAAKPPRATREQTAAKPPRDVHERTAAKPQATVAVIDRRSLAARTAAMNGTDRVPQPIATRVKNAYLPTKSYVMPGSSSTAYAELQRKRAQEVRNQNYMLMTRILKAKSSLPAYRKRP